ncbi:Serine/arginine repetitive matrix protein 2 OS=Streptomyces antimycoticus OX=68175 GN=SANT12839_043350 PE=4 SV=1 [Streptomyces antimycoticus]
MGEGAEPPAPGRRPPNPHLGTVLLAVLAVVLVGGIGVGAWKLVSGGGDDKPRADGGSPSASSWSPSAEQPTTVPSGPFSETTSAPPSVSVDSTQAPPTGYVRTTDAEGFRLDVPGAGSGSSAIPGCSTSRPTRAV